MMLKKKKWWQNAELETWYGAIVKAAGTDKKGDAPSSGQIQQLHALSLLAEVDAFNSHRYTGETQPF